MIIKNHILITVNCYNKSSVKLVSYPGCICRTFKQMTFNLIFLTLMALSLVIRPFTTLFHELGHALPAVFLTKKKVSVYIGSYGDPHKSVKLNLGKITIWFRYNPFYWRGGLCVPSATNISLNKQIVYTICGPLASLLVAVGCSYFAFAFDSHGAVKLITIIFLASATLDLFINLIPGNIPAKLYDGKIAYNDGYRLKVLLGYRKFPKEYARAIKLYDKKDSNRAADLFDDFLKKSLEHEDIYRLAIASNISAMRYKKALEYHNILKEKYELTSDDYGNLGLTMGYLHMQIESLEAFETSLKLNPENYYTLNNRGYLLNIWNRFLESIPDFDKAILIKADFAYAFNNRGLAKIKTGDAVNGLLDIQTSLEIDPGNAYAFRNLGIFHLEKKDTTTALQYFLKAKKMNRNTPLIDELIKETRQ